LAQPRAPSQAHGLGGAMLPGGSAIVLLDLAIGAVKARGVR
jgi:hypothetical protein